MPATFDVAVIGGGITGVSAALAARSQGASACLLSAAPGATALMSGAWSGPLRAEIRDALSNSGLSLVPAHHPVAHQRGDFVDCHLTAAAHATATVNETAIVCGIAGLSGFNAPALARLWQREERLSAAVLELPHTPAGGWAPASLATFLERSPDVLVTELERHNVTRAIFPAVLGFERSSEVIETLRRSGITAAEALASSPSIPGFRLLRALERVATANNIQTLTGRVILEEARGDRVVSLRQGNDIIHARSFVLATGKYLAGGITANGSFAESVFDLPVWLEHLGDVFTVPDPLPLTDPVRVEAQPLLQAGVHTDEQLRPLSRSLDVIYNNVFVTGTIRAGWNTAINGLGHCADDGWKAGLNAAA